MREKAVLEKYIIILLFVLVILFVIAVISIIFPYVLYFIGCILQKDNFKILEPSKISDYSVFISFLALSFTIAIATPYFISKKAIARKIEEYTKTEYKIELLANAEKVERTDAHISRMIAFNLLEEGYYYWAIGWGFRALKRYLNLNESYNGIYDEFCRFTLEEIILKALNDYKINIDKSESRFDKNNQKKYKTESYRIKLRAVKDYIDFKFRQDKYSKTNLENCINKIDEKMNDIIFSLYQEISTEESVNYIKIIDDEIIKLSGFKENPIVYKNFYYKKVLLQVFSNQEIKNKCLLDYVNRISKNTN